MSPETDAPRVKWKYELDGEDLELRALAKMFDPALPGGRVRVWFERDRYYLNDRDLEATDDFATVSTNGRRLVRRLNGLSFLKFNGFRPVSTGNLYRIAPGGGQGVMVTPKSGFLYLPTWELAAYLGNVPNRPPVMNASAGAIIASLPPVEKWVAVPERYDVDMDDALELYRLAANREDWRLLFIVYEIIEDYCGQPSKLERRGWAKRESIKEFKQTANSRRALGAAARHGRRKDPLPDKPMPFAEAIALVRGLLLNWIRDVAPSA